MTLFWVHSISQLPKRSRNRTTLQIRTNLQDRSIGNEKKGRGADGGDVSRCTSTPYCMRRIQGRCLARTICVECKRNVMAHAQKPDSVFQRNRRVHLYRRGCQFSRVLAFLECGSGENDCSNIGWTVPSQNEACLATHSIRLFPLHFSSRASPCATRFRFHSTRHEFWMLVIINTHCNVAVIAHFSVTLIMSLL